MRFNLQLFVVIVLASRQQYLWIRILFSLLKLPLMDQDLLDWPLSTPIKVWLGYVVDRRFYLLIQCVVCIYVRIRVILWMVTSYGSRGRSLPSAADVASTRSMISFRGYTRIISVFLNWSVSWCYSYLCSNPNTSRSVHYRFAWYQYSAGTEPAHVMYISIVVENIHSEVQLYTPVVIRSTVYCRLCLSVAPSAQHPLTSSPNRV